MSIVQHVLLNQVTAAVARQELLNRSQTFSDGLDDITRSAFMHSPDDVTSVSHCDVLLYGVIQFSRLI